MDEQVSETEEVAEAPQEAVEAKEPVEARKEVVAPEPKKAAPEDWRADLDDDLRPTAERFSSKADAIRAIQAFQKRESQVRVPGKNASVEEIAKYRKAIGIPESPDKYEFPELPEGEELTEEMQASRKTWSERFHNLGISQKAAKELSQFVAEDVQAQMEQAKEQDEAFARSQEEKLRSEWKGDDYDKNKTLANRAFNEIANRAGIPVEALTKIETKDGRFLMDRAEMLKLFSVIGREMSEGTLGPAMSESERDSLEDAVRDVRKQIAEAQQEGDSKRANKLYQKEQQLLSKAGNGPIVGAAGRFS